METTGEGVSPLLPSPSEFLGNLYKLIDDPKTNDVIRWKGRDDNFVIFNPEKFIREEYAAGYLGLSHFGLFIRCLYSCGLKKTEGSSFEYGSEGFREGNKDLVKSIEGREFPKDEPSQFPTGIINFRSADVSTFLLKLYDMVNDAATNEIVSWNERANSESFLIWDETLFCTKILPRYLAGVSFGVFIQHLCDCGFQRVGEHFYEYRHADFQKGNRKLLIKMGKNLRKSERRKITVLEMEVGGERVEVADGLPSPSDFLQSLLNLVVEETDDAVCWYDNTHVHISNPKKFILEKYPTEYLGVPDYGTFIRCLYSCGLRKIQAKDFVYSHERFRKGNVGLIQSIDLHEFPRDEPQQFPEFRVEIGEQLNVAPFVMKLYNIVSDDRTNEIVSWEEDGLSFIIWDPNTLCNKILHLYSIQPKFIYFIRRLIGYGFSKMCINFHQYSHSKFKKDDLQLLSTISMKNAYIERAKQLRARKRRKIAADKKRARKRRKMAAAKERARKRRRRDDDDDDESQGSNAAS